MKSFHRRTSRPAPQPAPKGGTAHAGSPRADQLLVERGLAPSRTAAQRLIEAGRVTTPAGPVTKASAQLPASVELSVLADETSRYVSRGALKLAGALAASGVDVTGTICLDVGQSTGGFTDCLLQAGAARVVGVDVGHGQLHPRLAGDPRVTCIEGVNARAIDAAALHGHVPPDGFDLIVADLSFISLTLVLPALPPLLAPHGHMLLLVKPQFEVGPQGLAKGGVVRDPALYAEVEARLRAAAATAGLAVRGWFNSPITGGGVGNIEGNREFFIWTQHEQA